MEGQEQRPPSILNISQTRGRVKSMILELGIFLVAAGAIKLIVSLVLREKERKGK